MSDDGLKPPRCAVHKTATVRESADTLGNVTMRCVLRGCEWRTRITVADYKKLYGERADGA